MKWFLDLFKSTKSDGFGDDDFFEQLQLDESTIEESLKWKHPWKRHH